MDEQTDNNPVDENQPPKLTPGMNPLTAAFLAIHSLSIRRGNSYITNIRIGF